MLVLVISTSMAQAQSGNVASIQGVVLDPSGIAVSNAILEAVNLNTGISVSTNSNAEGRFRFPVLPAASFRITARHTGFATSVVNPVELNVGANVSLTVKLMLAAAVQTVNVSSELPLLETTRTEQSSTVDNRFIANLPANGRDFTTFVLLTPGVTRDARGGLSFGGQRAMNSLLLDGINNDDNYWGQPAGATGFIADGRQPYYVSQDAVQEFQVNSNAYSAEYGRAGGGVINAITKSGTNQIHGSAFWFYRDKALNATDAVNKRYGLLKDPFHFNQFGGTLGGPIERGRAFFFFSYESMRSKNANAVFLNLPSGFQLSPDPTVATFQQTALNYLRPLAQSWVGPVGQNDYLGKIDFQLSRNHHLTSLWNRQRFSGRGSLDTGQQNSFEHTDQAFASTDTAAISLTSTFAEHAVNVARFGYFGSSLAFVPASNRPDATISEQGQPLLVIGGTDDSDHIVIRQPQWSDTLNYMLRHHALKMGADVLTSRMTYLYAIGFSGSYLFSSLESFGRSLVGQPKPLPDDAFQQSFAGAGTSGVATHPSFTTVAGFVQDEWRLRANLTLDIGVRYDVQATRKPSVRNPSPALAAAHLDTTTLPTDKNNFAPRVGIAWSPPTAARLVLRAGYGIFYAITPSVMTASAYLQNDVTVQTRTFLGDSPSSALIPTYPNNFCGKWSPSIALPACLAPVPGAATPTLQLFSDHYAQPKVQQYSAAIEFQLAQDSSVSVSYLAGYGSQLQQIHDVNLDPHLFVKSVGIANTSTNLSYEAYSSQRPIADFGRILVFESTGTSSYNALAVQVKKRFSGDLQALASYTLSKTIDDNPNVYALSIDAGNKRLASFPTNPRLDRGPGENDQRHRLVFSGVWEIAEAKRLTARFAKDILGGWQLSGILTAQSGQPYSGLIGYDLNNDGDFGTDRVPGIGRNAFRMPSTVAADTRVTRTFPLGQAKLEFIWEAFNLLNHANIVGINNLQYAVSGSSADCGIAATPCLVPQNQGLAAFGTPTSSSGPRIMQLAMRLTF